MSTRPRRPGVPFFVAFGALLGTAFTAWALLSRPRAADPAELLAGTQMITRQVSAVERQWIDQVFPSRYLTAPPGPLPCPQAMPATAMTRAARKAVAAQRGGNAQQAARLLVDHTDRHWLAALISASAFAEAGDTAMAQLILQRYLEQSQIRAATLSIITDSRWNQVSAVDSDEIRGLIYLMHAMASIQIVHGRRDDLFWTYLKNPIGLAKQLSLRGELGDIEELPTWSKLVIPAPGCPPAAQSLTTYDLYNNLLVAYLGDDSYHESEARRNREFSRPYRDEASSNPLQAVLGEVSQSLVPERENWVWAISNAERILRWSTLPPNDARLSYNLALLVHSALEVAPQAAVQPLRLQRDALIETAIAERGRLEGDDLAVLCNGITRLQLLVAVERGSEPELGVAKEARLSAPQRSTAEAIALVLAVRSDPSMLAVVVQPSEARNALVTDLGEKAGQWLDATQEDTAATIAGRTLEMAAELDPRSRWQVARAARRLLGHANPGSEELDELIDTLPLPWAWMVSPVGYWVMFLLFLEVPLTLFFLVWWWLATELRRRKALFTSFYRLEARALRRAVRRGGG